MTYALIAINAGVWLFLQGFGTSPALFYSICHYGLIPGELLHTAPAGTMVPLSESIACAIDQTANWSALFSSMFMHGSWFHILSNMWFLGIFGDNVEDGLGRMQFVAFYLVCGLAAAAAQIALNPSSLVPMVGASGAIGGVMGAYAILYPHAKVEMLVVLGFFITRIMIPAALMLGYWFLLQLLSASAALGGKVGGVAFGAHVGGFLMGIALGYLFRVKQP
jgi:membrane associated rhomboid family serine protease